MKKTKKLLSMILALCMLATQLITVNAETEVEKYLKTLIFEQDFDVVSEVNYSVLAYSDAPKTAGEFCLHGRTPSFDAHTSETDLCMTAPRVAADGYDYLVFTAPKALTGKYEIMFDFYASGDDGFYVIGGVNPMVGKVYQAETWNTVTMELDFANKTFAVDGTHAPNESGMPASSNTIQFGTKGKVKYDNFKIYEITENPDYYEIPNTDKYFAKNGTREYNRDYVDPDLDKITIDFTEDIEPTSVTSESVKLTNADGTVATSAEASGSKLTVSVLEQLKTGTVHWLTLTGVKTVSGKTGGTKTFSFRTNDKLINRELIFEQDFDVVSEVNYSALAYSNAPKTAGEFCLHGRTPSFDAHTSETDLCMTAPRVAASGLDYLVFTAPKALDGRYEITFDMCASGDVAFYVIGGSTPYVGKAYEAGTWNRVKMELDFVNKKFAVDGIHAAIENEMPVSSNTIQFGTNSETKIDNFRIYEVTESATYTVSDDSIRMYDNNGFIQSDINVVNPSVKEIYVDFAGDLNPDTVNDGTVVLSDDIDANVVSSGKSIKISLEEELALGKTYTLTLDGVKLADGSVVLKKVFTFTANNTTVKNVLVYDEDFDDVSAETLSSWSAAYAAPAIPKQWYFENKNPQLLDNTSADDKCIAIQPHKNGTDDYVYFGLPAVINDNEVYTISFDYYAAGGWCDWFYLLGNNDVNVSNGMDYVPNQWLTVEMTIDTRVDKWMIKSGNSLYTVPAANTKPVFDAMPISALVFRLHNAASDDAVIKLDNFKVYKAVEVEELTSDTFTIESYSFKNGDNESLIDVPTSGKINATVNLTVNKPGEYDFTAFIATYENDGKLENVISVPVSVTCTDTVKTIDTLTIDADSKTDSCRIFIWDMADGACTPLTESISLGD